jgi:hypothetical protein
MSKKIVYDDDVVIKYENLSDDVKVHFYNTVLTLSSVPRNFGFNEDPNPPSTTIVEEDAETTSLVV